MGREGRNGPDGASSAARSLAGRAAVVTGGSRGIGRAIALAFARAGADVVVSYCRSRAAAEEVVAEARALGRRADALPADLAREDDIARLVASAFDRLGRVDVWVNNAGADILTGEAARWPARDRLDLLLAVDLRGTVLCSWAVAERMRAQPGGGTILTMAWDHALCGMAGLEAQLFAAAKAGIIGFSKSLARSVAPEVRVNVLAPGWIATAFAAQLDEAERRRITDETPLRRWGTPDDVAQAALFLASPAAAFLTGVVLPVNGGAVT